MCGEWMKCAQIKREANKYEEARENETYFGLIFIIFFEVAKPDTFFYPE